MKFIISSTLLANNLQSIGKVISNKNTLPILDYFLFDLNGNQLKITASDLETTLISTLDVDNQDGDGVVAIPARRITDSIKEFSEQPLTIAVDKESWEVTISWKTGKLSIPGITGLGYPELPDVDEASSTICYIPSPALGDGINQTLFASADDELRPVMNGINIALSPKEITFVATDAHRLALFKNANVTSDKEASFILPKKTANLLKNLLSRDDEDMVTVTFDNKNAIFTLPKHKIVCRLIEGTYPNYNAVIPTNNPNKVLVDRVELLNSIKRVSVCSNQANQLIKLDLTAGNINLSAQDIDYAASAEDNISCNYDGTPIEIGFRSSFLLDLLGNIHSPEVSIELADPSRPGLFFPSETETEGESILMLLMPMMINA